DAADLLVELGDVGADLRADLDDRLMQLALELIAERMAGVEQLRHVRAQLPRRRIDDLELLLDADGEGVRHQAMISYGPLRRIADWLVLSGFLALAAAARLW